MAAAEAAYRREFPVKGGDFAKAGAAAEVTALRQALRAGLARIGAA